MAPLDAELRTKAWATTDLQGCTRGQNNKGGTMPGSQLDPTLSERNCQDGQTLGYIRFADGRPKTSFLCAVCEEVQLNVRSGQQRLGSHRAHLNDLPDCVRTDALQQNECQELLRLQLCWMGV
jgi:hypothetical protein